MCSAALCPILMQTKIACHLAALSHVQLAFSLCSIKTLRFSGMNCFKPFLLCPCHVEEVGFCH